MPLVQRHVREWGKGPEIILMDSEIKRTTFHANGAIANTYMIDISINFEPHIATMA